MECTHVRTSEGADLYLSRLVILIRVDLECVSLVLLYFGRLVILQGGATDQRKTQRNGERYLLQPEVS